MTQQAWDVEWFPASEMPEPDMDVLTYSSKYNIFEVLYVDGGEWWSHHYGTVTPDFIWTYLPIPPRSL